MSGTGSTTTGVLTCWSLLSHVLFAGVAVAGGGAAAAAGGGAAAAAGGGKKILLIPAQHTSHPRAMLAATEALLDAGHQLHTVLADSLTEHAATFRRRGHVVQHFRATAGVKNMDAILDQVVKASVEGKDVIAYILNKYSISIDCEAMAQDKSFISRLRAEKYDYAIADGLHLSRCHGLIPHQLGIGFSLLSSEPDIAYRFAIYPSTFRNMMTSVSSWSANGLSIFDKLTNILLLIASEVESISPIPSQRNKTILNQLRRSSDIHSYGQVVREADIFFLAYEPLFSKSLSLFPNTIVLGGITNTPGQKLSEQFERLLNQSPAGTVVLTLGSQFSLRDFGPEKLGIIFRSISKRPEQFVIRGTPGSLPELTDNAVLVEWLPQNDLLADKRVKLFIGHGGVNGLNEAIYHGVPVLCIPLQNEQRFNGLRTTKRGFGHTVILNELNEQELDDKMSELLDKDTIRDKVHRASRIIQSRPMNGKQLMAFWIEHVIEFGGEHLRPTGLDMTAFEYYMLDLLLIIFTVSFAVIASVLLLVRWIVCYSCCKRGPFKKKEKVKKK